VATYGAENWIWSKNIAKRLAAFERKVSTRMSGRLRVNET
jgi:hypothetical protein